MEGSTKICNLTITPSRKKGMLLSIVIPVVLFYFLNYECMIFFKLIFFKKTFSKSSNKNNNSHYFPSAYHLWETYLILYTNLSLFLRPALQSKIIPILQMRKLKIRMNKNIFNCLLLLFMFCLFLYLSSSSKIFTIRGPFHQVYRY